MKNEAGINGKKSAKTGDPPDPEKNVPEQEDDENDCTRPRPGVTDPHKTDPTRIEEPGKNDPTRK
ncbi:MAG: hypothetical protein ACXVPQ_12650, partial [Bacteroidia bacterium]